MPVQGVGALIANDILTDVAFWLIEPCVNTIIPAGGIGAGSQTVNVWDASLYVGAQVLVGVLGGNLEVVTLTATVPGVSFTATFTVPHIAGEAIIGATFPVQNTAGDPFFTQAEMLQYLSNAVNEFLLAVPLVYNVTDAISMPPTQQFTALPSDCMLPVRISAFGIGLRETSQSNLDGVDYRWMMETGNPPMVYYRDKIGVQNFGIWPVQANTTPVEIVYQQRGQETMGLGDGFLVSDPFLVYVKARVLEFAYSKDGEQSSPALARFWNGRYEVGCKISKIFLEAVIEDPNMQ
jgi:hypothetical protein